VITDRDLYVLSADYVDSCHVDSCPYGECSPEQVVVNGSYFYFSCSTHYKKTV
jgi:hypothetical protein